MNAHDFDPTRLDVEAFASEAGELAGNWPLSGFGRVGESLATVPQDTDQVVWSARGERRLTRGGAAAQTWLHVSASGALALQCQRCLQAVAVEIQIDRNFMFVPGEAAAAQLDAETDDDVLELPRALDLRELVEDEILLAMPLVPRHDVCPEPLSAPVDEADADEAPHPFAALAALKKSDPAN